MGWEKIDRVGLLKERRKKREKTKNYTTRRKRRERKRETNYNILAGRKNEHSSSKSPAGNQPAGNLLFYSSSSTDACNNNASAARTNPAAWCPTTGTRPPSNAAANPRLNALARCGPCQRTEEQPRRTGTDGGWQGSCPMRKCWFVAGRWVGWFYIQRKGT